MLFQLEEGIEALEAAIEYKNETIQSRQNLLRASFQNLSHSEANVLEKLICLTPVEIRAILFRYFNKVCFFFFEEQYFSNRDQVAPRIYI
jgi:kinesin family protein 4/21/27